MKWWTTVLVLGAMMAFSAEAGAEMRSVKVPTANFREGPSLQHDVLFTADQYYPVRVLNCDDGWCKIEDFEGDHAFVAERLLGDQATVVIKAPKANVRTKPSTQSSVLFKLERGEALRVTGHEGSWVQVVDGTGDAGWVHKNLTWGLPAK